MGFRMARMRAGITQQTAAECLGVTQEAISQWESGKTMPRGSMLPRVCQVYNCTLDELLEPENEERSDDECRS